MIDWQVVLSDISVAEALDRIAQALFGDRWGQQGASAEAEEAQLETAIALLEEACASGELAATL